MSLDHRFQQTHKKKSPASLWIKSVAQIRWADLGDHRQGIKWIKCFNPLQQEKKKSDWLTGSHIQTWTSGLWGIDWDGEVALTQVYVSAELRWVSDGFALSCWCAWAPHYIIHMLHNTLAEWRTLTHTRRHTCPEQNWVLHGCPFCKTFLLYHFLWLRQSMLENCVLDCACLYLFLSAYLTTALKPKWDLE